MSNLLEGDINLSVEREQWSLRQMHASDVVLSADSELFLHQTLSTPCLDTIVACEDIYLVNAQGRRYMDFHGNNVHQVGYRNQAVLEAVKKQMDTLCFSPRRFTNPVAVQYAEALTALFPGNLKRVLFAPGGTSAVSIAIKLARLVTGKHKVVSLWDSFHGASLDAIGVGGEAQFRQQMGPLLPGVERIPPPATYRNRWGGDSDMPYADYLEYVIEKEGGVGAFIAETIRNTDVQIPSPDYWKRVREICTKHGVLLILDEIPIAFGRTGKMFAFEHYGIEPDIICLGKGMGGGVIPMAGIVTRDSYNAVAANISLGHFTFEKSPLGCAAGMAVLQFIQDHQLLQKVQNDAVYFQQRLHQLQQHYPLIGDVRGKGLLWGIELVTNRETKEKAVTQAEKAMYYCLEHGLSFKVSQGNVLQLSPPLIISRQQQVEALQIVEDAMKHIVQG
ncbi:4-aminobutyrate aminotransferase apoenzyme [Filimonas lacunae]|uniref:4-aminobutyrate aminotransferase apoenzyme n=1 Tax=Filimonas lacunae TaxID=477680 RepID=A0A173MKF7_9BACT|nr:aspartate aminotransferase family protein [Filimonas lacunae]BAV07957.1 4-aminobutyrate aminotransferase [Filimonas lacunae]SIT07135.1 4-aminobutyrate aminotransferase apoenzyme [Filimonas lacunae]